jgi:hypothetical protein
VLEALRAPLPAAGTKRPQPEPEAAPEAASASKRRRQASPEPRAASPPPAPSPAPKPARRAYSPSVAAAEELATALRRRAAPFALYASSCGEPRGSVVACVVLCATTARLAMRTSCAGHFSAGKHRLPESEALDKLFLLVRRPGAQGARWCTLGDYREEPWWQELRDPLASALPLQSVMARSAARYSSLMVSLPSPADQTRHSLSLQTAPDDADLAELCGREPDTGAHLTFWYALHGPAGALDVQPADNLLPLEEGGPRRQLPCRLTEAEAARALEACGLKAPRCYASGLRLCAAGERLERRILRPPEAKPHRLHKKHQQQAREPEEGDDERRERLQREADHRWAERLREQERQEALRLKLAEQEAEARRQDAEARRLERLEEEDRTRRDLEEQQRRWAEESAARSREWEPVEEADYQWSFDDAQRFLLLDCGVTDAGQWRRFVLANRQSPQLVAEINGAWSNYQEYLRTGGRHRLDDPYTPPAPPNRSPSPYQSRSPCHCHQASPCS